MKRLMFGSTGDNIVVWDKSREERGDYKKLAYISNTGRITWYISPDSYLSDAEFLEVSAKARWQGEKWEKKLGEMPLERQYRYLLYLVPPSVMMFASGRGTLRDKVDYLKGVVCEMSHF